MNFSDFFEASCPFPLLKVPPFVEFSAGKWRLRKTKGPPIIRGYFGGFQIPHSDNWMLTHKDEVWMSVTPMELESSAHHVTEAKGAVLVMGFGMGVVAWNLAQKDDVTRVLVVEKDESIIKLAQRLIALKGWEKLRSKIVLHRGDALDYKATVDFVTADIWQQLGATELRGDLRQIAKNVKAKQYAAWGIEIDFIEWCSHQGVNPETLCGAHWIAYSKDIGVPLIMSGNLRKANTMAQAAVAAARNVIMY